MASASERKMQNNEFITCNEFIPCVYVVGNCNVLVRE